MRQFGRMVQHAVLPPLKRRLFQLRVQRVVHLLPAERILFCVFVTRHKPACIRPIEQGDLPKFASCPIFKYLKRTVTAVGLARRLVQPVYRQHGVRDIGDRAKAADLVIIGDSPTPVLRGWTTRYTST